jgi:hypothetical protein
LIAALDPRQVVAVRDPDRAESASPDAKAAAIARSLNNVSSLESIETRISREKNLGLLPTP